jgi:hypothetical protein
MSFLGRNLQETNAKILMVTLFTIASTGKDIIFIKRMIGK